MKLTQASLLFADSHQQPGAWANRPIRGDATYALEQIANYAIDNSVAAVFGAGDLIDKQSNRSASIVTFFKFLDRLQEAGIPFYFIQGQHEMDNPPWLSGHPWATHLHRTQVAVAGIRYYGLDYCTKEALAVELQEIPEDTDVLVAHQVWADWMGDIAAPQAAFSDVPHVGMVFSGDLHKTVCEEYVGQTGQTLLAVSPGSTCMQDISEPPDKSFTVLQRAKDKTLRPIFNSLQSRRSIQWDVMTTEEDLARFVRDVGTALAEAAEESTEMPEHVRTPLLRCTYSHRLKDAVREVEKIVGNKAHIFWKEIPPTADNSLQSTKLLSPGEAVTPLAVMPTLVSEHKEPEVFSLLSALLTAPEGAEADAYATWFEETKAQHETVPTAEEDDVD